MHGSPETGVSIVQVKKLLEYLCEKKNVVFSDAECDRVISKLFAGKEVPETLNFEQFRVFFATALARNEVDLTESLAVDQLAMSMNK